MQWGFTQPNILGEPWLMCWNGKLTLQNKGQWETSWKQTRGTSRWAMPYLRHMQDSAVLRGMRLSQNYNFCPAEAGILIRAKGQALALPSAQMWDQTPCISVPLCPLTSDQWGFPKGLWLHCCCLQRAWSGFLEAPKHVCYQLLEYSCTGSST